MNYSDEELNYVFDKTNGKCFHCGKQLAWDNYGMYGKRGAWQVDHGNPTSRGGTNHLNNLHACCMDCNLSKSDQTTNEFHR